jgi:hypothetical protein
LPVRLSRLVDELRIPFVGLDDASVIALAQITTELDGGLPAI